MAFEVLHRALMGFGLVERRKSSQVAALAGLRIFLARIQTISAGFQFANHLVITTVQFFRMIAILRGSPLSWRFGLASLTGLTSKNSSATSNLYNTDTPTG